MRAGSFSNPTRLRMYFFAMRSEINQHSESAARHQLETLQMEFEMTDKLKRIYSLTKRIARIILPQEV